MLYQVLKQPHLPGRNLRVASGTDDKFHPHSGTQPGPVREYM